MKTKITEINKFTVAVENGEEIRTFVFDGPGTVVRETVPRGLYPNSDRMVCGKLQRTGTPLVVSEADTLIGVVRREWRRLAASERRAE